ncbi:hypothetical protein HYW35_04165 [Candidatus Saccharibacteria bacterium]|nr:hypothetical protein [Candidatus Saccharibacteria bacterium]
MINRTLRVARNGYQESAWTKSEILAGLERFFELNNRYPTSREIDKFEFLPSSRSLQRQFGGLVALRKELIPASHADFTRGSFRSNVASETWHRATKYEEEFFNFLQFHFQPFAIHEHKIIRPGNVSSDYYIYLSEKEGVIIDLFYAAHLHSLMGVVNIKLKRYIDLPFTTYLVLVGNHELGLQALLDVMGRRKVSLPENILVDTETHFKESTVFELKQRSKFSI